MIDIKQPVHVAPRLIYHYGNEEFHALGVELKADKVEFRSSNESAGSHENKASGSETSLTSSHGMQISILK